MKFFILNLFLFLFLISAAQANIVFRSKSGIPQLVYNTKASERYQGKDTLIVKGDNFTILATRLSEENGMITWKTNKIKVRNKDMISDWPDEIKELVTQKLSLLEASTFSGSVFSNPISYAVWNKQKNINAGWQIGMISNDKHEFSNDFSINAMSMQDEISGSKTSTLNVNSNLIYDFNNFYGNWTYFAIINYQRSKFNDVYTIRNQWGAGIAGLKYSFIRDGKYFRRLNVSYVPMLESVSSDENINFPGEPPSNKTVIIRNSFRFKADLTVSDWGFTYNLNYRPAYNYNVKVLDMQDVNLFSELVITRPLTKKLSFRFTNTYTYDIRQSRSQGLRPDNTINSFALNYAFEF